MAKVTINLFGAAGQRTIEIQPKGGFSTRHIKIGSADTTPLPEITPDLPKAQPKPAFARNIDKHEKSPELWDQNGRPVMAVARLDEFMDCQELAKDTVSFREYDMAVSEAARRGAACSEGVENCVAWYTLAVRCLNISKRMHKSAIEEIRVYRFTRDHKRIKVYEGVPVDNLDARCQAYADKIGNKVEWHNAATCGIFQPTNPIDHPDDPPIGGMKKSEHEYKPKGYLQRLLAEVDAILAKAEGENK